MFTAMGKGRSKTEAKQTAAKALLEVMAALAKEDGSGVDTNSTRPEA